MTRQGIFKEEKEQLERCISRIDELLNEDKSFLTRGNVEVTTDKEIARGLRRFKVENISKLTKARPNPYFGRIDFVNEKAPEQIEKFYFGEFHIPRAYVFSLGSPVGDLWYKPLAGGYKPPKEEKVSGSLNLKRELFIEETRLLDFVDVLALPAAGKVITAMPTRLDRQLSESKGGELKRIIATIQPEQYEIIASTPYRVLMVQGVAGSGKSEIGIHRIVYLLSPHNELDLDIAPNRVASFGPSQAFLKYVSNLLPGLGVEQVRQMTIPQWLKSTLPGRIGVERKDMLLEKLLKSSRRDFTTEIELTKLKVSQQMASILDRHVRAIRRESITRATDIIVERKTISKLRVKKILQSLSNRPINEQRRIAISTIESEIGRVATTRLELLHKDIEAQFDRFWPELDYKEVYLELLSNQNALVTAANGNITTEEALYFSKLSSGKAKSIKTEDLAAICYTNYLLNGMRERDRRRRRILSFQHIIVDEAQDVSPLEFMLLYLYSANKSFTILGDIGQCVLPHRGLSDWSEVKRVFSREHPFSTDVRISYRATYEITKYANRILKLIAPSLPKAKPYERHGGKPALIRSKTFSEMVKAIAEEIRSFKANDVQTIAVLCKTSGEASRLQKRLYKEGIDDAVLLGQPKYDRTKVVVSSIYDSKGLEYDAVILANARKNNYIGSVLHNRLLYIAVTRAAHYLQIHWFGTLADILVDPSIMPKTKKETASKKRKRIKKS